LALALGSEGQVVLLDEPATNLDAEGIQWLQDQLNVISRDTLLVVATNDQKKEGFQGASILEV
jgi:ATPase subunit of ABC transporter with duplicated ATPase domains